MKKFLFVLIFFSLFFYACKKEDVVDPTLVDLIYQIQTNFADSTDSIETEYATFKRSDNTFYTINQNWNITPRDSVTAKDTTFTRIISFGLTGLPATFTGFSRTTDQWKLRILSADSALLKEGIPVIYQTSTDTGYRVALEIVPQ